MLSLGDQFRLGSEPVFHVIAGDGSVIQIVHIGTVRHFLG